MNSTLTIVTNEDKKMNEKIFQLVCKLLDSDLGRQEKTEIVKFFLLPRNTPIRPIIEMTEEEIEGIGDVGPIDRPTVHDIERKNNPEMAKEEDAMSQTLKGVVK